MNETAQQQPRFAVVGHPNKGKSSVVATLAPVSYTHLTLPTICSV